MFKFKKVALVTCISVITCTSLVFAATKLNNALYNNKGEKIFEVNSSEKIRKEYPDAINSNELRTQLTAKFHTQSYLVDSQLKEGEMAVKLFRDKEKGVALLDYNIKVASKDYVSYNYDSKFVDFTSFDEFKTALGGWAKLPKYLPTDTQFSSARIRYSLDPELISQLRKEMLVELETKTEDFTYRIIKAPTKSILRNTLITFTSEKYGTFSINLFHGTLGVQADNDGLISRLTLENNKEAILDKNNGTVFYADESQMKELAALSPITWLNKPSSDEFDTSKSPLIYSINKLGLKSIEEAKKILESIE